MVIDTGARARGVDDVFHALADATRRDIVATLLTNEHSVSALARRYPMSFTTMCCWRRRPHVHCSMR